MQTEPLMTTGERCPYVRFEEIHAETTPALWHMDNLDNLRDQARRVDISQRGAAELQEHGHVARGE